MSLLHPHLGETEAHPKYAGHRFTIRCEDFGRWRLESAEDEAHAFRFRNLTAALDHARQSCGAEPAEVEIWVDGFYIYVHQRIGWPERICAAA